jgi:hypothetical protein
MTFDIGVDISMSQAGFSKEKYLLPYIRRVGLIQAQVHLTQTHVISLLDRLLSDPELSL